MNLEKWDFVKNKKAPGETYAHYSLPGEIDQEIADVDNLLNQITNKVIILRFKTKEL